MDKEKSVQTASKEANLAAGKPEEQVVHSFDSKKSSVMSKKSLLIFVVVIVLGVISGFGFSQIFGGGAGKSEGTQAGSGSSYKKGDVVGSSDQRAFKDTAEGVLKKGGVEGEGAYHLVRPGGDSQNVYLTSSALDLSLLIGRKIKVWGQTNTAQTAGWLMDVGRVQVLN